MHGELQRKLALANQQAAMRGQMDMLREQQEETRRKQQEMYIQQLIVGLTKDFYLHEIKHKGVMPQENRLTIIDECHEMALEFAERMDLIRRPKPEDDGHDQVSE